MTSNTSSVIFGLLLVTITIVVQSMPVKISSSPEKASLASADPVKPSITSSNAIIASEINDLKQKRTIDNYNLLNDLKTTNKLSLKIKETPAQIHDIVLKSVDTDNSKIFTDIKMQPDELTNLARRRRTIHLNDQLKPRQKRSSSTYDSYNTDPFHESSYGEEQFLRPPRTFVPIYWYPSFYTRNLRSALAPSFYEPSEWNRFPTDDTDEDQIPFFPYDDDDVDDENDYGYNRYPILFESSSIPYDNLQLQQEYNINDLPIDEDDEFYSNGYGPIESYLK